MTWALIKIVNFNLNEMDNLMYPWQPLEKGGNFASIVLCTTSFSCYLQNRRFLKYIGQSILLFCLSVCLSIACRSQFQTDLHEASPPGRVCHKQEVYCFWGQKVNNWYEISKILNFQPIDLKFEEDLYFRSLNSTSQLFLRSTSTKRST